MSESLEIEFGHHPDAELVFGIVCPLGTDHQKVVASFSSHLADYGYRTNAIRLSEEFDNLLASFGEKGERPLADSAARAKQKIKSGNRLCRLAGRNDFLALVAASRIAEIRPTEGRRKKGVDRRRKPVPKTAHVISTLKRTEEVAVLRRIYGGGFLLIGLAPSKEDRDRFFRERGMEAEAAGLMEMDEAQSRDKWGQRTRDTFQLADVFVSPRRHSEQLDRFLKLLFGSPEVTPNAEEHAMFMAYSASLLSGDLSRQVGAAVIDPQGDLLAVGCNEVPKPGGGHYGPEDGSHRDVERREDSNHKEKEAMIARILQALNHPDNASMRQKLKGTGLPDLTEFGRTVHAEMQALLACARTGRSPRDATLFTTTFPCHNCCRHIIAAGIRRVVYIEPYPKSKAKDLHDDAICVDGAQQGKIPFEPFIGVGPRRFFDLFSLKLSTGYPIERKENGKLKEWRKATAPLRLQMQPASYLDHESLAMDAMKRILSKRIANA